MCVLPARLFSIRRCAVKRCCIARNHSISHREQSVCLQHDGWPPLLSPRSQFTLIEAPLKHKPGQYSTAHTTLLSPASRSPIEMELDGQPVACRAAVSQTHTYTLIIKKNTLQTNKHTHKDSVIEWLWLSINQEISYWSALSLASKGEKDRAGLKRGRQRKMGGSMKGV